MNKCKCGHNIEDHINGGCCYFEKGLSNGMEKQIKFLCNCEKFVKREKDGGGQE